MDKHRLSTWLGSVPSLVDTVPLILIVCLVAAFSLRSTLDKANTVDEMVHVLAGHAVWTEGDYRLNPENGTLPCRIAALPLQFMNADLNLDTESTAWSRSDQWHLGHALWFNSPADHRDILRWSHLAMLLFNLSGIGLVFFWSGQLWGRGGAYLSLLLAGFSPNFLGHMPLATSDFSGAWTLVLAAVAYARLMERITLRRILAAGFTAALALLCKHTGILLAPAGLLLLAWRQLDGEPVVFTTGPVKRQFRSWGPKLTATGLASLAAVLACTFLVWLAYGFRYSAVNPDAGTFEAFQVDWSLLSPTPMDPVFQLLRRWQLLPEAFLYGLNFILSSEARGAFLNGTFSPDGFFGYHFWTFLYKTPIPAMLVHLSGTACLVYYLGKPRRITLPPPLRALLVLGFVYAAMLLGSDISIGHRHAFPLLYIACILSGICGSAHVAKRGWIRPVACLLAISMVPLSWANIHRALAYTNPIGGGPDNGYKRLNDSSLDWGQDLPAAIRAIEAYRASHPGRPAYLSYFGTADPEAHGLKDVNLLYAWGIWGILERPDYVPSLKPGLYAISASEMDSMPADWTLPLEIRYQTLKRAAAAIYQRLELQNALASARASSMLGPEERKILDDYELFRTQRLKMYLTQIEPDEILNGSILLFDLSAEDLLDFEGDPGENQ